MQFWVYCRQYSTIKTFSFLDLKRHVSSNTLSTVKNFSKVMLTSWSFTETRHKYVICQYLNKVMTD